MVGSGDGRWRSGVDGNDGTATELQLRCYSLHPLNILITTIRELNPDSRVICGQEMSENEDDGSEEECDLMLIDGFPKENSLQEEKRRRKSLQYFLLMQTPGEYSIRRII